MTQCFFCKTVHANKLSHYMYKYITNICNIDAKPTCLLVLCMWCLDYHSTNWNELTDVYVACYLFLVVYVAQYNTSQGSTQQEVTHFNATSAVVEPYFCWDCRTLCCEGRENGAILEVCCVYWCQMAAGVGRTSASYMSSLFTHRGTKSCLQTHSGVICYWLHNVF